MKIPSELLINDLPARYPTFEDFWEEVQRVNPATRIRFSVEDMVGHVFLFESNATDYIAQFANSNEQFAKLVEVDTAIRTYLTNLFGEKIILYRINDTNSMPMQEKVED